MRFLRRNHQKAVGKLDGVRSVSVNLATENADVVYEPARVRPSVIKDAIREAGYTPRDSEATDTQGHDAERKAREIRTMWTKFIVAASSSVPLLYLALVHMIPGTRVPLPPFLDPMRFPLRYALTQVLFIIPAVVAGNRFYRVGAKALWHRAPNMDSLIAIGTAAAILYSLYNAVLVALRPPRCGEGPLLRDGSSHSGPDSLGEDPGGCFQGKDLAGHQDADGSRPQDCHGDSRWKGDRNPHLRGRSRGHPASSSGRESAGGREVIEATPPWMSPCSLGKASPSRRMSVIRSQGPASTKTEQSPSRLPAWGATQRWRRSSSWSSRHRDPRHP